MFLESERSKKFSGFIQQCLLLFLLFFSLNTFMGIVRVVEKFHQEFNRSEITRGGHVSLLSIVCSGV